MSGFLEKLEKASKKNNSLLCVGLDTDSAKIPQFLQSSESPLLEFNRAIIKATKDFVCCYKPNSAFYEAAGIEGIKALEKTLEEIPSDIPVILDAKRGDIGNTSRLYAQASFEALGADAVTLSPYMGFDTLEPFLEYEDKAVFVLVKTSNKSSKDFQDLIVEGEERLFEKVASALEGWQAESKACIGAVVGATHPADLQRVREIMPAAPILLPGLGAQGGDAKATVEAGLGPSASAAVVINSSRGIIFASNGEDFAEKAGEAARSFRDELNSYRPSM